MSIISTGAIQWITRILGTQKFTAPTTDVDDGHVTLVADVIRQSGFELSSGPRRGYWVASTFQTHIGVGAISELLDLINPSVASEGYTMDEATQWAWVMSIWASVTDLSDFADCVVGLGGTTDNRFIGPSIGNPSSEVNPLFHSVGANATGITSPNAIFTDIRAVFPALVVSPQDGILFGSTADNAGTTVVAMNVLIWIGPIGIMPPGMS